MAVNVDKLTLSRSSTLSKPEGSPNMLQQLKIFILLKSILLHNNNIIMLDCLHLIIIGTTFNIHRSSGEPLKLALQRINTNQLYLGRNN